MAKRGPKPKVAQFPERTGAPGKAEHGKELPKKPRKREEPLVPLRKLSKIQQEIWDEMIEPAWWLTRWDRPKAHMYVVLQHEQLTKSSSMPTPRYRELRMLATELGLDTGEQARQGIRDPAAEDPGEEFFS